MGGNVRVKDQIESLKDEIILSFNGGDSCKIIVKKFDLQCHDAAVLYYLKKWGVDTTHKYNPEWWGESIERNETILHLLEEGKTQKEVADLFGISLARVGQIYRRSLK